MKKISKMFAVSSLLFGLSIVTIGALETREILEGERKYHLQYGYASAHDSRDNHNYTFQTKGTCEKSNAYFAVFVRDRSGATRSSDSRSSKGNIEASLFADGKVTHTHVASCAPISK